MAGKSKEGGKGKKGRKLGRKKDKCARYRSKGTREKNKLKRVLKSNGLAAAESYAAQYNIHRELRNLLQPQPL